MSSSEDNEHSFQGDAEPIIIVSYDSKYSKLYNKLSPHVQRQADQKIEMFTSEPLIHRSSLRHHEIRPTRKNNIIPPTFSISISRYYRAMYRQIEIIHEDAVIGWEYHFIWVGGHADYDVICGKKSS